MDYSAISDHPSGSSPWGSPRADKTAFSASDTNDNIPSSPTSFRPQSQHGTDDDRTRPSTANHYLTDDDVSGPPDLPEQLQRSHLGDSNYHAEQPPYDTSPPQQNLSQDRSQLPARYQVGARQHVNQPAPVYRVQAKITGLERTGKKDPIFRFDIHVRLAFFFHLFLFVLF